MPFVYEPDIKILLGVATTDTSQDAQLRAFTMAAEAIVQEYTGRLLASTNYVEYYSGNGTSRLPLRQRPVTLINNVWVDFAGNFGKGSSAFPTTSLLTQGTDYVLDYDINGLQSRSGILYRLGTNWSEQGRVYFPGKLTSDVGPAHGNIKIDYVAGYTSLTLPEDLKYAIVQLVSFMRRTIKLGTEVHAETLGRYSYQTTIPHIRTANNPALSTCRQILNRYKEVPF